MNGSRFGKHRARPGWQRRARSASSKLAGLAAAVTWIGLVGCGPPGEPGPASETAAETADVEAVRDDLMEADRAFARATAERGVEGWVAYFAPEGAMVRGRGEITGDAAIRDAMAGFLADTTVSFTWEPVRADAAASGDLGYTIGTYEIRARTEGELLDHGMYLTVWERQTDGTWKVAADIGSPAPQEEDAP